MQSSAELNRVNISRAMRIKFRQFLALWEPVALESSAWTAVRLCAEVYAELEGRPTDRTPTHTLCKEVVSCIEKLIAAPSGECWLSDQQLELLGQITFSEFMTGPDAKARDAALLIYQWGERKRLFT